MAEYHLFVTEEKQRIDKYIATKLNFISRSKIQSLIKEGYVILIPGSRIDSPSHTINLGEEYHITIPEKNTVNFANITGILDIVYEDQYLAVINKPTGLTVHPGIGTHNDTLVDILLQEYGNSNLSSHVIRPGIVHRLDKNTSGLMIIAKDDMVHASLAEAITKRQLTRKYIAVVHGVLKNKSGVIDAHISPYPKDRRRMHITLGRGKHAITHYQLIEILNKKYSIVECTLATGRTHQIRVHMNYIGHPILGDITYGSPSSNNIITRQALHSYKMTFNHPITKQDISLTSTIPNDIMKAIKFCKS